MSAEHTLDRTALDRLLETVGGDQGFVTELIETFLEEAPTMLAEIRSALEAQDAELLRRAAHSLKSNAAQFGAARLQSLCLQLEQRAKEQQLDGLDQLLVDAESEFQAVHAALR